MAALIWLGCDPRPPMPAPVRPSADVEQRAAEVQRRAEEAVRFAREPAKDAGADGTD